MNSVQPLHRPIRPHSVAVVMGSNWEAGEQTTTILDILEDDPQSDIIAFELSLNMRFRRMETSPSFRSFLLDMLIVHQGHTRKPLRAIVTPPYVPDVEAGLKHILLTEGISSFPTFQRAGRALRNCLEYQ